MMTYKQVGISELKSSRIAMGCWQLAGGEQWGNQDEQVSVQTVHAALDAGINFFDTAPGYGNGESERVLGKALKGRRDRAIIATKISRGDSDHDSLLASCDRSLGLLQTDRIDLLQLHWPNHDVPFEETIAALDELKTSGKVRYLGICNFGKQDLPEYLDAGGDVMSNQLPYSLLSRAIEYDIQPQCVKRGISILAYSPLLQGLLTGKFKSVEDIPENQRRSRHFSGEREACRHGEPGCEEATFEALRKLETIAQGAGMELTHLAVNWLLEQANVANVLVGMRTPAHVARNVKAREFAMSPDILAAADEATREVKEHLGPEPDLWAKPSRFR